MYWEERHLDREGHKESQEEPQCRLPETGDLSSLNEVLDGYKVEAAGAGIEPQDCGQHEHRRDHGVQEELDRGVDPAAMAENADDQRHRDERRFPEEVKQEQIERDEDADHRRLKHQHEDEEFL